MKKILLLGGSAQRVTAIDTAKRLGYSTIFGNSFVGQSQQYHADKFYLVSATDKKVALFGLWKK